MLDIPTGTMERKSDSRQPWDIGAYGEKLSDILEKGAFIQDGFSHIMSTLKKG